MCYEAIWKRTQVYFAPMYNEDDGYLIMVGDLQKMAACWGHELSKSTIRHHLHTNKLFGRHAKCSFI